MSASPLNVLVISFQLQQVRNEHRALILLWVYVLKKARRSGLVFFCKFCFALREVVPFLLNWALRFSWTTHCFWPIEGWQRWISCFITFRFLPAGGGLLVLLHHLYHGCCSREESFFWKEFAGESSVVRLTTVPDTCNYRKLFQIFNF
jgi:hypothetical protein